MDLGGATKGHAQQNGKAVEHERTSNELGGMENETSTGVLKVRGLGRAVL